MRLYEHSTAVPTHRLVKGAAAIGRSTHAETATVEALGGGERHPHFLQPPFVSDTSSASRIEIKEDKREEGEKTRKGGVVKRDGGRLRRLGRV